MTEIRKKVFQGLDTHKSPEPRHSQLIAGEVEIEGSRERDNYRVPITGTEMEPGRPWGEAYKEQQEKNDPHSRANPYGSCPICDKFYQPEQGVCSVANTCKCPPGATKKDESELKIAARKVLEGFDKEIFVRNTENDGDSDWAVKLMPYIIAMQKLTDLTK